jgi:phosphorylcholine metabolism protein LicD
MSIEYLQSEHESESDLENYKNNKVHLMNYLLQKVVKILNDNKIPYYLDCGTLLGCIRENELMEKDTDIDVTTHISSWKNLNAIDFNEYDLIKIRTHTIYKNMGNMISVRPKFSNFYCDIYSNPAFPQLDNIVLNGNNYSIPINNDLYLTQLYGNWRVPSGKHASALFHRGQGLVKSEYSKYWDKKYKIDNYNINNTIHFLFGYVVRIFNNFDSDENID